MIETILSVLDLPFLWAVGICLLGGIMHGYTGWGGGLVMMPLLTLIYGPVEALALAVIGGVMVAAQIYPAAVRTAKWREMRSVYIFLLLLTPAGSFTLLHTDPDLVRRFIGGAIIAATIVLMSGWQYGGQRGPWAGALFGGLSGYINGFSGTGGPILALYVMAFPDSATIQRANIVIGAGLTIFLILVTLFLGGAIGLETMIRGLILGPAQMIGGWTGTRLFHLAPQEFFRRVTLVALIVLGIATVLL